MYRKLNLPSQAPDKPGSIPAGQPTHVGAAHATLAGMDTILGSGRRVLLEAGLQGASAFFVPDGEPTTGPARSYPDEGSPRVVAQALGVPLTAGHVVAFEVLALPSGPTQKMEQGGFVEAERSGRVELLVVYRNTDGEFAPRSEVIEFDGSDEPEGGEPESPWSTLLSQARAVLSGPVTPDAQAWAKWTGAGVTVDLTLRYSGAPRVVDVVVVEHPWVCTVDIAAPRRPAAMYSDEDGVPLDGPASSFPIIHTDAGDRALGCRSIAEAIEETGVALGPVLWSWSAHRETVPLAHVVGYDGGVGDGAPVPWQVIGTQPESLPVPVGSLAQGITQSAVLEASGVLRVWLLACWKTSGAPAYLELHTGDGWEVIEADTDATGWTWTMAPGWVEAGTDALAIGELRMRSSAPEHRVQLRYAGLYYAPS